MNINVRLAENKVYKRDPLRKKYRMGNMLKTMGSKNVYKNFDEDPSDAEVESHKLLVRAGRYSP